ncbi:MAG: InlB B-repeat-containing protein, partial [Actinomycetales bacterium]|nr:InlB B-repeat-containing protein [Actinomycetales bacterium]
MSYAVTSGTLPAGLSIDPATGIISGTPSAASSSTVTVTATGSTFGTATTSVTFNVTAPAPSTVTYDGNGSTGGTVPVDAGTYASGASVTVLGNTGSLAKSGFTFAGWNTAANASGTSYAPGSSFLMGSSNVTLYAKWTAVTPPAPAPPAPAPSEPATEPAPPAPAPSPSASPALVIIQNQDNRSVPPGAGVAPGGALLLVGGVPSGVRVVPDRSVAPTGLDASGDGFTMRLRGLGAKDQPLGLAPDGALVLESSRSAEVSGTGFRPNAPVKVFL